MRTDADFTCANHGIEEADMHARHAYELICEAINQPDLEAAYLEGAKALLRQTHRIMERLINESLGRASEVPDA